MIAENRTPSTSDRRLEHGFAAAALVLTAAVAMLLLRADYAALTWGKFKLSDYGKYTNMVWNCGHGRPFTLLVDSSYLSTHLSFTLALLGPFFRVWDHPFLLSAVQWLTLLAGAVILWRSARARGMRADVAAALVLFFVANPFTQSVMLSEYHGVSLYFVLMPWLYAEVAGRRASAWLPFLLLLGVREEAGALVVPMLVYCALVYDWRPGLTLAAVAAAYFLLATTTLFPWLAHAGFVERRAYYLLDFGHYLGLLTPPALAAHAAPFFWCAVVAAPFLFGGGWLPILVFPSVAALIAATSAIAAVFELRYHYPAALVVLLTLGIVDAVARSPGREPRSGMNRFRTAVGLVVITLVWHRQAGFLPYGANHDRVYATVHPAGQELLRVVREIPKQGVLLCPDELAGFCANRADLLTWEYFDEKRHRLDLVFLRLKDARRFRDRYRAMLESGEFGVRYFDHGYVILERGNAPARNPEVLRSLGG